MRPAGRPDRVEQVKGGALAVLVAGAVVLNAALWLRTPGGGPLPRPEPYVAGGNAAAPPPGGAAAPLRVVAHRGGRHALVGDRGRESYRGLVAAAAALLETVARQAPAPVPADEVAARRREAAGWELVLPVELPVEDWLAAWTGREASRGPRRGDAGGVPARRLSFFLSRDGSREARDAVAVYVEGSAGAFRVAVAGGGEAAGPGALEPAVLRALEEGEPAVEVPAGARGDLVVPPGLFVPVRPGLAPVAAEVEPLDAERLSRSFFPDPGVVRRVEGRDGYLLLTDGRQGLLLRANRSVRYERATPPRRGDEGLAAVLEEAAAFVALHGGWPPDAFLLAAGRSERGDRRLTYAVGLQGRPVLGTFVSSEAAAGEALLPPLAVEAAPGGGIRAYDRFVPRPVAPGGQPPGSPEPAPAGDLLPAEAALQAVRRAGGDLPGARRPATVTDLFPAFAVEGSGPRREFRPVWAVVLDGEVTVPVDALTGRVRGAGRAAGAAPREGAAPRAGPAPGGEAGT